jgi:hypothetical protein
VPPRLVVCRCCATGKPAYACCPVCEARQLEVALERRGLVAREHPADDAWGALVASYHRSLDERDGDDRARDAAQAHEMEAAG